MPLSWRNGAVDWQVNKIVVIGPGIVGTPMAALLADAGVRIGGDTPAEVVVLQRASATSGWKVDAINAGRSPIGGIEPELDAVVARAWAAGRLRASHDYAEARDADVVLVCVQTDKAGAGPDYGPLLQALDALAAELARRPAGRVPLVIIESTLAPSSMATVIRPLFERHRLRGGRDVLLANSPNRVMPGRLVERVRSTDKLVAGLDRATPALVSRLYQHAVTQGRLWPTNSLTAEIVKTLENAYRDVRIAYAAEVARFCDAHDVDFHRLRREINRRVGRIDHASDDPTAVPTGGLLVPTLGVGGHCLPKDGVLLWWRAAEAGMDTDASLILASRRINDASPCAALRLATRHVGPLPGRRVALLGVAYRFDSEDARNSPTLALAAQLAARGSAVTLHDPYVRPDDQYVVRSGFADRFRSELPAAVADAEVLIFCVGHGVYADGLDAILRAAPHAHGVVDAANLYPPRAFADRAIRSCGVGRGTQVPAPALVDAVEAGFRAVERGVANEVIGLVGFLNARYVSDAFNMVAFSEVQRLARTCGTGCDVVEGGPVAPIANDCGFTSELATLAARAAPAPR